MFPHSVNSLFVSVTEGHPQRESQRSKSDSTPSRTFVIIHAPTAPQIHRVTLVPNTFCTKVHIALALSQPKQDVEDISSLHIYISWSGATRHKTPFRPSPRSSAKHQQHFNHKDFFCCCCCCCLFVGWFFFLYLLMMTAPLYMTEKVGMLTWSRFSAGTDGGTAELQPSASSHMLVRRQR